MNFITLNDLLFDDADMNKPIYQVFLVVIVANIGLMWQIWQHQEPTITVTEVRISILPTGRQTNQVTCIYVNNFA